MNFQMFKLDLEKPEEPEIKFQYLLDHQKSKRKKKGAVMSGKRRTARLFYVRNRHQEISEA